MSELFMDGFAEYNSLRAFSRDHGGKWKIGIPSGMSYTLAKLGGAEIYRQGGDNQNMMVADLGKESQLVAASFITRMNPSAGYNFVRIGFSPRSWPDDRTVAGAAPIAFEFLINGTAGQNISYGVPNASPPSVSLQRMVLASNPLSLAGNQAYHVQILVDIRGSDGIFKVFLNGTEYFSATFPRGSSQYRPNDIGSLYFHSGQTNRVGCGISDLLVYEPDDADFTFPFSQPVKISYVSPSAVLATPADDSTFVTISTNQFQAFPMPAGSIPEGTQIICAEAIARVRAETGIDAVSADIKLDFATDDEVIVFDNDPIAPGFASKMRYARIPKNLSTPEAINTSAFEMRSPEVVE